jgi:hypothetical protein
MVDCDGIIGEAESDLAEQVAASGDNFAFTESHLQPASYANWVPLLSLVVSSAIFPSPNRVPRCLTESVMAA